MTRGRGRGLVVAALAAAIALAAAPGCEGAGPVGGRAGVWTAFDFQAALEGGTTIATGVSPSFPAGWPAAFFVRKSTAGDPEITDEVVARLAFVEGKPAAYLTTEVWTNYRALWVQPMYILVTRWNEGNPTSAWLDGARWILPVGEDSLFYSPFWQVTYVVVPEGTPPERYRSSTQLFADRLPMHRGPGRLVALVPDGTGAEGAATSLAGRLGHPVGAPGRSWAWVDGVDQPKRVLDFGERRFEWNDRLEVEATPLFVFTTRQTDGAWLPAGLPNVGGTGPLFARRPPLAPGGRPAFGSLWRLHTVRLPAGNEDVGVFLPSNARWQGLSQELAPAIRGVAIPEVTWEFANPADARKHLLKVALNARTCFRDEASLAQCRWLDSQSAIEETLPAAIATSEVLVTCPLVTHDGEALAPP